MLLVLGTTFAQSTFYVNNLTGNDANSGTTPGQAKATVGSAMIAAPAGSFISVAATGVNYIEVAPTVRGTYTFTSTGGTPVFSNALNVGVAGYLAGGPIVTIAAGANATVTMTGVTGVKNGDMIYIDGTGVAAYDKKYFTVSSVDNILFTFKINSVAGNPGAAAGNIAARGDVTFQAPFQFAGINLNVGQVSGGDQVTVAGPIYRTELSSVLSGGFVYSGNVNLTYDNRFTTGAVTINTGLEWPTATIANNLNTAVTAGPLTLKLDNNRTIKGVLGTLGAFNLNTYQLTINGANAHTIGGDVTAGTFNFMMTGAASIGGAFKLANVIADRTSGAAALTINATVTETGDLTVNSSAALTANVNGNSGNILANGSGAINWIGQTATSKVGTVTSAAASTSNITFNNLAANLITLGTITHNGTGVISFGANVNAVNVGTAGTSTHVILNTTVPNFNVAPGGAVVNKGQIIFPDFPVTIWGQVQNNVILSATTASDVAGNNNNGSILFSNTTSLVTIKSTLLSNVTGTIAAYAVGGSGTGNGVIQFNNTTGNLVLANVTNQSTANVPAGNARIIAAGGGVATLTFVDMLCSSTDADASIDFSALTGNITGRAISQTGSTTGGDILLGTAVGVTLTGDVTSSRGATGADIVIGGGAALNGALAAKNINNSGKSNITFNTVSGIGTVTLGASAITSTGTGTISFPNAGAGAGAPAVAFTFGPFTVSDGTVDFGNGTGGINATGVINLTKGTINFSGAAAKTVTFNNATINIGGVGTKPTFAGNSVRLSFAQPIPNVNQIITLGTLDNTWPGFLTVDNNAAIPAPYVYFKSVAGTDQASPGLLYILNAGAANADGLVFDNTLPAVVNFVEIDNARLFVGRNAPVASNGGGFQNTGGYTTKNGGFVMMSGGVGAAQVVNTLAVNAGATFGNFGVSNNSGTLPSVTFATASVIVGDFYLANGQVNPTNVDFTAPAPYSTIYRTEGTFSVVLPNPTSKVNVTYYGADKVTSNEVPAGVTKLWNLTVSTTNGAKPGYGIISMNGNLTVNGTLTIDANQALYTSNRTLTMAGSTVVINGYLVDDGNLALGRFVLAAPAGTNFTGAGYLPTLVIANASMNNTLTGYTGVYSQGFGADGVWGGAAGNADDFTTADGNISYVTGAGDTGSSLTVGFIGNGPHFGTLNIGNAPVSTVGTETFTITSNTVMSGNINQGSGLISLGDFLLTHNGTAFVMDTDVLTPAFKVASITSNAAGQLVFPTTATTLTTTSAAGTIAANVTFRGNVASTFTLPAASLDLTITGNVVLSGTVGANVRIDDGRTLTLGGPNVTVNTGSLFTAAPGILGTGILVLNNAAPNTLLTFTTPAATAVANLTIGGNVTLAGAVAGGAGVLTVGTSFIHNSGLFTFGTANLQINGTFTRNGGTYAGDGWLIYNGGAAGFQHSAVVAADVMTINNFQLTSNMTLQNTRNFNVVKNFYLNGGSLTNQVAGAGGGYVFLGDATTVPMVRILEPNDVLVNALQFTNANADYTFNGPTGNAITSRVWPATTTLARHIVVNMAAAGNTLTIPARTINGNLTLTQGVLTWDDPVVVTVASGSIITRTANGALNYDGNADGTVGVFTAPLVNLVYTGAVGNTGIEYSLPTVVNNFTMGTTAAASAVTLNSGRTIAGVVTINNAGSVLTIAQNTTFAAAQTITAGTITVNAPRVLTLGAVCTLNNVNGNVTTPFNLTLNGNHTAGTITASSDVTVGANGSMAATSNLAFVGANNAKLTVPDGTTTVGSLTFNKDAGTNTITLAGGNIRQNNGGGTTTFINGVFLTGAFTFTMNQPNWGGGQGFDRTGVTGTKVSHVVGNVNKVTVNIGGPGLGGSSESRIEFPVGTNTLYRPVALTFNPSFGLPTVPNATFTVTHTPQSATGAVELPILNGVAPGVDVSRYPDFYWNIKANPSIGPDRPFDIELTSAGFTAFDDINNVRIIRRHGTATDVTNQWLLQGDANSYDNETVAGVPTIIQKGANAGLRNGGAIYTLGMKSNIKIKTEIPKQWLVLGTSKVLNISNIFQGNVGTLTYEVSSSNATFVSASVVGYSLTLNPLKLTTSGDVFITLKAMDVANNDFFVHTFLANVKTTDVEEMEIPTEFSLSQNYPNPFNPTTSIRFGLPKESNVTLRIFNILGEEVASLVNGNMVAGFHTINFDASRLASGMYIYRIDAGNFTQVKKMILMK